MLYFSELVDTGLDRFSTLPVSWLGRRCYKASDLYGVGIPQEQMASPKAARTDRHKAIVPVGSYTQCLIYKFNSMEAPFVHLHGPIQREY